MAYNPYGQKRDAPTPQLEPVSLAQDDHPALSRNMLRDLEAERAKEFDGLLSARDWADFEKRRGKIHGLDVAIVFCQEAKKRIDA